MAAEENLYDLNTNKSSAWATLCQSGDCHFISFTLVLVFFYSLLRVSYYLFAGCVRHSPCSLHSVFVYFPSALVYDFWVPLFLEWFCFCLSIGRFRDMSLCVPISVSITF